MYKVVVFVVFSLFICFKAAANNVEIVKDTTNELVVAVTTSYVMGDGDTRVDAKNVALQAAKKLAAERAGSYVQAERVIENDEIKEDSISMISTAMMNVEITNESLSITDDQRTKFELSIKATLDKDSVMAKLGVLQDNVEKQQQLVALEAENSSLRDELSALNSEIQQLKTNLQSDGIQSKRTDLIERRDLVLSQLEVNESSVRKVFEKGTLFSMAKAASHAEDEAKRDLDFGVFKYLQENLDINLGDPEFRDNGDGTYNVQVMVHWHIDGQPIIDVLNQYFRQYKEKPFELEAVDFSDHMGGYALGVKVKKFNNSKEQQLLPYTYALYQYLLKPTVKIKVSAGSYSSHITIATSRACSVSCGSTNGDSQYQIHFSNRTDPKLLILKRREQNPVVIENVPATVLQNLTRIEAAVEVN